MEIIVLWVVFCGVVAYIAERRHRSSAGFFFLSFFLSPLVGFAVLVATPAGEPDAGEIQITRED